MKISKRLTVLLLVCILGAVPAISLAAANYNYSHEKYYVNGVQGKGLVVFKGSDTYLPLNDSFTAATGITMTRSGDTYTLSKGSVSIQAKLVEKYYTVNGVKRWNNMAPLIREEGQVYLGCGLLTHFDIQSSWDFGTSAMFLTTNGLPPYKNSYQLSNITGSTATAKNTVTNETIQIRLAGILANGSFSPDFYKANDTIATLAFDSLGQDEKGQAYAYVWLGDTMLNQALLTAGLAQLDPAFQQSDSPYYQQLVQANSALSQTAATPQ